MIKVVFMHAGEVEYDDEDDATCDIIERVVDEQDMVESIINTETGKELGCDWSVKLSEL